MNTWLAEIWRSWRESLRHPAFALLAIGVLALGVGASAAVFTLLDDTLLQPLPVPQPDRLVVLGALTGGEVADGASPMQYQHMSGIRGIQSLGLEMSGPTANVAGGEGEPELVHVLFGDRGLLPTLGIQPILGRNFSAAEDRPGGPPVAMLTWKAWQQRFGGSRNVIGQTLETNGHARTIVGVLPKSFDALGFAGDIMVPFALPPNDPDNGTNETAVGRLSDGADVQAVDRELNARLHAMSDALPNVQARAYWAKARFGTESFQASVHDGDRPILGLFMISALFVLAIALVNLTNLMQFRALSRSHDAAVRNALGAPLLREWMPALAEGLLIGIGGAVGGLVLAFIGLRALHGFVPADWLNGASLQFGPWTWILAFVASLVGTLLAVVLGLWRSRVGGTTEELRTGGRNGISRRGHRLGRILVVFQIVLATGLLCAVGVFLHTLYDAQQTPLGFAPGDALTFEMSPSPTAYPDAAAVDQLTRRVVQQLDAIPGVTSAVATTNLPTGGPSDQFNIGVQNPSGQGFEPQFHGVGRGFFRQLGIQLRAGRLFSTDDVRGGDDVAIVDQAVADRYYGGHALNQMIHGMGGAHPWAARIVGVVDSTYQYGATAGAQPVVYVPLAQMTDTYLRAFLGFEPLRFVMKVNGNPYGYRDAVRRAVGAVASNQPVTNFRSMQDVVSSTTAPLRLNLLLVGVFAALALLLASVGLYAVMAVATAAREHEFGVRTALGATPKALLMLVMRDGLVQAGIGLGLGVILALTLSIGMSSVVEALGSTRVIDPVAIIGACVVLGLAAMLACMLPALRAARVQPMRALRGE